VTALRDVPIPALFRDAIHGCATAVLIIRSCAGSQAIVYANPAFERLSGHPAGNILGRDWSVLYAHDHEYCIPRSLRIGMCSDQDTCETFVGKTSRGTSVRLEMQVSPMASASINGSLYIALIRDVTAAHAEREKLEHHAYHDALTGLANRHCLQQRLTQAIARAQRHSNSFAVVFVDLDGFKPINDNFGHEAGDRILRELGNRLIRILRLNDTAARVGGDEFVLLLEDIETESVLTVVDRIFEVLQHPFAVGSREIMVSCCVGITRYPGDGDNPETLLRNADRAMYKAKKRGNGQAHPRTGNGVRIDSVALVR
jgi:diguanylate cyclase (GGDEF)-like protein/PAS domain S-box-containing protein